MPRQKMPYTAICDYVGSVVWVKPSRDDTAPLYREMVPAIEAKLTDGRTVYVTFEMTFTAPTGRAKYIERMRKMAATLKAAADRAERETTP